MIAIGGIVNSICRIHSCNSILVHVVTLIHWTLLIFEIYLKHDEQSSAFLMLNPFTYWCWYFLLVCIIYYFSGPKLRVSVKVFKKRSSATPIAKTYQIIVLLQEVVLYIFKVVHCFDNNYNCFDNNIVHKFSII